ncbi:ATP-binding protein [Nitratifractor sp.]|uniref:hybrid sensor histidine kinase/response regulator n=1 Tax=Nitratifractor sp. TaxID=2268144 RepID=UPI0025E49B10|nr:ATP-binding protein [Nitratifractor sp.]
MNTAKIKELIQQTAEEIESTRDDNFAINRAVESLVREVTGAEYASIWMNEYPLLVREREKGVKSLSMEEKQGLLYRCFVTKEPAIYNYLTSEKGYLPSIDNPDDIRIKSKITLPLLLGEDLLGIVTCYSSVKKIKNFGREELERFKTIVPVIIEAMITMQKNRGRSVPSDRRKGGSADSGLRRRSTDIVRRLEALESAEKENASLSQIEAETAAIVHDIRTPANNLLGFLKLLEEQIEDPRLREYLDHAEKSARMINDLTTSILDSFSMRLQKHSPKERVSPSKYFSEIGETFSARMYEKGIHYNIFIDPNLPREIEIDAGKLKRVLMNLLGNAVKFTQEKGTIEYSVSYISAEKKIHCSVRDSGIGIPKEKQEEIFRAFTQADETTKARYGGTGLGLSISADYVREMGGKLSLESEVDRGSTFFFDLPVGVVDSAPKLLSLSKTSSLAVTVLLHRENLPVAKNIAKYFVKMGLKPEQVKAVLSADQIPRDTTHLIAFESTLPALKAWQQGQGRSLPTLIVEENFLALRASEIPEASLVSQYGFYGETLYAFVAERQPVRALIVDDDRISVELVRTMLAEEYCHIETAYDGTEGEKRLIEALEKGQPFDLLFTDRNMPGRNGAEMIRHYRKIEKKAGPHRIKTVSISGDVDRTDLHDVFDYLATKPFQKEEIVSIVREIQPHTNFKE